MTTECMLTSTFGSCCCNCKYRVTDYYHCTTVDRVALATLHNIHLPKGCVCEIPKGYICTVQEGHFHSNWSEHGMCEMHEEKES